MRLTGPPVETIKLDAEIDATDQLEIGDQNTLQYGIAPQLAALETTVYPPSATLQNNFNLSQQGVLEIMPMLAPFALFVWSANRIAPVRITELEHHRRGLRSRRSIRSAPRSAWACAS